MAPKGQLLVVAMVILVVGLVGLTEEANNTDFLNRHIDYPKTAAKDNRQYCNLMMKRRGMATNKTCKKLNTFINQGPAVVNKICTTDGTPTTGDRFKSKASFPLTNCWQQSGSPKPPCNYDGNVTNQRIEVSCDKNHLPVHFAGRF